MASVPADTRSARSLAPRRCDAEASDAHGRGTPGGPSPRGTLQDRAARGGGAGLANGDARGGSRHRHEVQAQVAAAAKREKLLWKSLILKQVLPKSRFFVLHPQHHSVQHWNFLIAVLLLIQAIFLPLQLAYIPNDRLVKMPWLLWFNCWVELVLWMDIALQFFLEIPAEDHTFWITDLRKIAGRYLRQEFLLDLGGVMPLSGLYASLGHQLVAASVLHPDMAPGQCSIMLVGFHKLLRLARWSRVMLSLQAHDWVLAVSMQLRFNTKRLITAVLTVLLVVHVMGCAWTTLAVCKSDEYTWFQYLREERHDDQLYRDSNSRAKYMCALYWAVFTLTGIGYGDVVPVSPLEYIIAICCMLAGSLTWAWVVANMVSVMATMHKTENDHLHTLDCINQLLRHHSVDAKLGRRYREYFTKMREVREQDTMKDEIIAELSPELQIEVVYAVHGVWIEKVWWLHRMPFHTNFMVELADKLKAALYTPGETLPNRPELNIIRRGLCIHGGLLLSRDRVFGEDLLLNNEALRKPHITLVLTFLHVLAITKSVLESTIAKHPEVMPHMRRAFVILAVQRGVLYRAGAFKSVKSRGASMGTELVGSLVEAAGESNFTTALHRGLTTWEVPGASTGETAKQLQVRLEGAERQLNARMGRLEAMVGSLLEQAKLLASTS